MDGEADNDLGRQNLKRYGAGTEEGFFHLCYRFCSSPASTYTPEKQIHACCHGEATVGNSFSIGKGIVMGDRSGLDEF